MCICLNCKYLSKCNTYYLIEDLHQESHVNKNPKFFPQSVIISINFKLIEKIDASLEWDVSECLSYEEKPANWVNKKLKF